MFKIGIDEAGRGPWLGQVVAATFCLNPNNKPSSDFLKTLDDSKKITEKKREVIFDELIKMSQGKKPQCYFGVGVVDNYLIDEINIRQATKEAMRRALVELLRKINPKKISSVVVDGNDKFQFDMLSKSPIYIIGGDAKVLEIKAASIIAKVFRDRLIRTYSSLYPELGLENHKGYGTKMHRDNLVKKPQVTGIHRISYKPVAAVLGIKPKLLIHVCCGPDVTIPIVDLKDKYDITCFWYDPNIHPKKEYVKRLKAFKKVCKIEKIPFIEGEYDIETYYEKVKGYEDAPEQGKRCELCYDFRLERSAQIAKEEGFENFTTSLSISPHKDIKKIFKSGSAYGKKYKVKFLKIEFRKNDGFNRSVEYTKDNGIYRQNYCGCVYSMKK